MSQTNLAQALIVEYKCAADYQSTICMLLLWHYLQDATSASLQVPLLSKRSECRSSPCKEYHAIHAPVPTTYTIALRKACRLQVNAMVTFGYALPRQETGSMDVTCGLCSKQNWHSGAYAHSHVCQQ